MGGSTLVLPLPFASTAEDSATERPGVARTEPLWLAVVFPQLALEALDGTRDDIPCVVVEAREGRYIVHTASRAAQAAGVTARMPLNAAYVLCPTLRRYEYDAAGERRRLGALALWSGRFTSRISIAPPRSLLLEIRGSLRLFGGVETLHACLHSELRTGWCHEFASAIAPTASAALLLAQGDQREIVLSRDALRSVLGPLPIEALPLDERRLRQLGNTGIRMLRDLWRLPWADLARRFGPELTDYLGRLLGKTPDPRAGILFPETFAADIHFPLECRDHGLLLSAAGRLLTELEGFLRRRDAGISRCAFHLYHPKGRPRVITIGTREVTREGSRLLQLLAEHLRRLRSRAVVTGIGLYVEDLQRFPAVNHVLPPTAANDAAPGRIPDIERLLEQLQARLGHAAVGGVRAVADHRPEHAARLGGIEGVVVATAMDGAGTVRPLWLLPQPQRLVQRHGLPWRTGPLRLHHGPERIEGGWWAGIDVRRDYYGAQDCHGSRLWIYRDLRDHGHWYLHGLFA